MDLYRFLYLMNTKVRIKSEITKSTAIELKNR